MTNSPSPGKTGLYLKLCVRIAIISFFLVMSVWAYGFYTYWNSMQTPPVISDEKSDAIVVLTGGSGRVDAGLELLQQEKADVLFISGVGKGLIVEDLLALWSGLPENISRERIILGYAAQTTHGNAVETTAWMARRNFTSLRLVTSSYHMPRALLEFEKQMPDIKIISHPVKSESLDMKSLQGLYMLAREYTKLYAIVLFEDILEKLDIR